MRDEVRRPGSAAGATLASSALSLNHSARCDTLADEVGLAFTGIPYFAPEVFRAPHLREPIKTKQLAKGLRELGEEGAARLKSEYGVDAVFEPSSIVFARWLTCDDPAVWAEFNRTQSMRLGTDVDGNWVYLAPDRVYLKLAMENYPKVEFHATREHGARLSS